MIQVRRRQFLLAISTILLPSICAAQQAGRVYRLGLFGFGSRERVLRSFDPLLQLLGKSGFAPGRNLDVVYRVSASESDPLDQLAHELAAAKLDAVFVPSVVGAFAMKRATAGIPFEQAMYVNAVVNLKTARDLGITIPTPVLLRAARVIEWSSVTCACRRTTARRATRRVRRAPEAGRYTSSI